VSGLEDRLEGLPGEKATPAAGVPDTQFQRLYSDARSLYGRQKALRGEAKELCTGFLEAFQKRYGPAITNAAYDLDKNELGVTVRVVSRVEARHLEAVLRWHDCESATSGFTTIYRKAGKDVVGHCQYYDGARGTPAKYVLIIDLDFPAAEQLMHELIRDYLAVKPVQP
jgi:hypothetical protein